MMTTTTAICCLACMALGALVGWLAGRISRARGDMYWYDQGREDMHHEMYTDYKAGTGMFKKSIFQRRNPQ